MFRQGLLVLLVNLIYADIHVRRCPERSLGLDKWSDASIWPSNEVPTENSHVIIDRPVLLDIDYPTVYSIHIQPAGYLIWGNQVKQLKVHWINVEGEMHIGGPDCRYTKDTKITFVGDYSDVSTEAPWFDKGLYVQEGGVLEIHGEEKLSWTKLTKTAKKLSTEHNTAVVDQLNLATTPGVPYDEKALLAYNIHPDTGNVVSEKYFEFTTTKNNAIKNMEEFVKFIDEAADGNIIGFAVLRKIDKSNPLDLSVFENKVAELGYGDPSASTVARDVKTPGAYAFVTKKGDTSSTVESYVNIDGLSTNVAEATQVFNDIRVYIKSHVQGAETSFVKLVVSKGDDELFKPKLDLLDDASSWEVGDEVVITSTDYDWRQAEVRQIVACNDCSNNQIRINDALSYTHYGEIYKNVDMRAEVGLLTRNIRFDSEAATDAVGYGGHLRFLEGFESVRIEDAEFANLGASQVLGRYSLHFHMCRDVKGRQYLRSNSIHDANTRCVTIHGTHNSTVENNVCYKTKGHGYFLEDGGERDTVLDGNLGLGTEFGELIPSDQDDPTTFWITNPNTEVRNNVAAGSDGHGIWFVYPDEPLGPSAGQGFMVPLEARYTPIKQFYNNIAHSNVEFGLNIDNILQTDGTTSGYNLYIPKEDPVMHALYSNSTNKEVVLERFTAYKNSERNTWIRGGWITMTQCSFSDSLISTVLIRQTTDNECYFEKSVIVGISDNIGEPLVKQGVYYGDRSYPKPNEPEHPRIGWEVLKKPDSVDKIWFDGFPSDKEYDMGAIGFRIDSKLRTSPQHQFTNIEFSFTDPEEGNRVINYPPGHPYYTDEDGDDNESFMDLDGSVTGYPDMTVILPVPFHMTDACTKRPNWEMALCKHHYATIRVNYGKDEDEDAIISDTDNIQTSANLLIMARDDDRVNAYQEHDIGTQAPFIVILGGSHSYSMHFTESWPNQTVKMFGLAVTHSEYVRAGICIPKGSTFDLKRSHPKLKATTDWTQVNSFEELDNDSVGDKYLYDSEVGYLAVMFRHTEDREEGVFEECPQDSCLTIELTLDLTNANRNDINCFNDLYSTYTQSQLLPQNGPQIDAFEPPGDDVRILDFTRRNPPATWGAGSTKEPAGSTTKK